MTRYHDPLSLWTAILAAPRDAIVCRPRPAIFKSLLNSNGEFVHDFWWAHVACCIEHNRLVAAGQNSVTPEMWETGLWIDEPDQRYYTCPFCGGL